MSRPRPTAFELGLLSVVVGALVWSGVAPYDRLTWLFETAPVWLGAAVLIATHHRFRFTPLVYCLIAAHGVLLCVGGHYTYSRVPLFDWLRDAAELGRNHYDRFGHLAQGFVPAMIARELFLRQGVVPHRGWRVTCIVAVCLGVSVLYELAEYAAAMIYGGRAEDFLATQGDVWDTHADMACALLGAVLALLTLSRPHDRQLARRGA